MNESQVVALKVDAGKFGVGDLDACRVAVGVELAAHLRIGSGEVKCVQKTARERFVGEFRLRCFC